MSKKRNSKNLTEEKSGGAVRGPDGRFVKGKSGNPGGRTAAQQEFKDRCEHLLMNGAWDRWNEILMDKSTSPNVVFLMVKEMMDRTWGKPNVSRESQQLTLEDYMKAMPVFNFKQEQEDDKDDGDKAE